MSVRLSRPLTQWITTETWNSIHTHSPWAYLKMVFGCFRKIAPRVASHENLPHHVDFSNSAGLPYQNPREASSRSRIFLFSLVNMWLCWCICLYGAFLPQRKKIKTWNLVHTLPKTISKNVFFLLKRASSLEKLPCHVYFPHISSIALFSIVPKLIFISFQV